MIFASRIELFGFVDGRIGFIKQLDSTSKNKIIKVLNCTKRTQKLLKLTRIQGDDTNLRCSVIADATHIETECKISNKILFELFKTHYPNSDLTLENFQFFIPSKSSAHDLSPCFCIFFCLKKSLYDFELSNRVLH